MSLVRFDLHARTRCLGMTPLKTYPFLDPIRDDPRFRALLNRMNLEP